LRRKISGRFHRRKTLNIDSHVTLPNGEFDIQQVFEKQ